MQAAENGAERADLALVRRAQAGDVDAFGELVDLNRRAVFRAALAALGSASEAEDVAQDTFVAAYQKLATFRGDASFKTWLVAIAWRRALDRRRQTSHWMRRLVGARPTAEGEDRDPMAEIAAGGDTQEQQLMTSELQHELRTLIATLPGKLRDALMLACAGEYGYDDIAAMLGIPVGTLKWRVSEARRVLKRKLAAKGYVDAR